MKQKTLLKTMLLLCALIVGYGSAWADVSTLTPTSSKIAPSDDHFTVTYGGSGTATTWGGNSCVRLYANNTITFASKNEEKITQITFTGTVNANSKGKYPTSMSANVGTITPSTISATGEANFSWTDATGATSVTLTIGGSAGNIDLSGGEYVITYTPGGGGSNPSISADNVNITQDATNGSIAYTLNNATGNVSASITSGDWLTLGTITATEVPFTCSANTGAQRTATVTLSFTGATDKVVTITQAAKTVAAPVYNPDGGSYFVGTEITLTSAGNTIYYNLTTDGNDPAKPTTSSTEYTSPIVLGTGTTKIKAFAVDAYGNESSVASRTFTGIAVAELPFSWDSKTTPSGVINNSVGTYNSSPYLKFDAAGDNIILRFDEVPGTLTFDIKGNGAGSDPWAGTFKVQTSTDGETYSDLATYTELGDKQSEVFNNLGADVRYIKWIYVTKDAGNVALGNINLYDDVRVTLAASGYASFCSPLPLDLTPAEDYAAYVVTQVNKDAPTVLFEKITGAVPAETPFILYGEGKGGETVNLSIATGATTAPAANMLIGTLVPTPITTETGEFTNFGLSGGKFVKMNNGTIPANKAYLPVPTSFVTSSAPALTIVFGDDETTGIGATLNDSVNDNVIYDLSGRRVEKPTKGLYIVNGKKVVIK